ncbi:hypothetical protein [Neopusillimonas aromaticivorans]|uniref:hypothetical protein n=1 Tax=Neopusillimonas aromaticivorans TaxID=2979868 RepID=UPI00259632BF|nr:hypothetical protein [Neopusillimonas aromaticivorans]WJJ93449.1 hypothetical protein N7E01_16035 [Neopusillimonas aromaticivorans]
MATAGSIVVDLLARTGSFETDIDRAAKKARQFGADAQQIAVGLDKVALGIAGMAAAGITALTAMAVRVASAAAEISNFSAIAGASTVEFQRMAAAASTVGISQEKLADQLKDFQEKVGEFIRSGGGGMKDFFEQVAPKVGVTTEQFRKLSGPEGLQTYYNALQKAGLNQKEMSFYLESMASDTTALIPILHNGGQELNRLADRAQRFGYIMSEDAVKQSQKLHRTLGDLGVVAEGTSRQIGVAMTPALQRAAEYALAFADSIAMLSGTSTVLESISESARDFVDDVGMAAAGIIELGRSVIEISSQIGGIFSQLDAAATAWVAPFMDGIRSATSSLSQSFSESVLNTAREIDSLVGFAGGVAAVWKAVSDNLPAYFDLAWAEVLKDAAAFVNDLAGLINPMLKTLGMDGFSPVTWGKDILVNIESVTDAFNRGKTEAISAIDVYGKVQAAMVATSKTASDLAGALGEGPGKGAAGGGLAEGAKKAKKALTEAEKAAQAFAREREQYLKGMYGEISSLSDQADKLEDQVRYYGLSESALNDLTIARLEEQKAALMGIEGAEEEIAIRQRMIEQYQRMGVAMRDIEAKEAEKAAWQQWSRDVEGIFQQVSQSLTDAIFEGGKSGRDLVKDLFKTLTLRVLINPVMNSIQGAVTNSLGGIFGVNNPAEGGGGIMSSGFNLMNMASAAKTAYGAFTGGITSTMANGMSWAGETLGSTMLSNFAAGFGGTIGPSAVAAGNAAAVAGGDAIGAMLSAQSSGAAGLGAKAAAAVPVVGWVGLGMSLANSAFSEGYSSKDLEKEQAFYYPGYAVEKYGTELLTKVGVSDRIANVLTGASLTAKIFDMVGIGGKPTTRHGQWEWAEMSGDNWGMKFRDSRQPAGTGDAITQYARSAVDSANATFGKLGVNAAIEYFYATTNSSLQGDRNGVASGGTLIVDNAQAIEFGLMSYGGDRTKYGYGGWSKEEMLPRLQTDIQISMLEAFQTQVDQMPELLAKTLRGVNIRALDDAGIQAVSDSFNGMINMIHSFRESLNSLPFEQLRDLSFDAAANLIQFAGGLDSLNAGLTTYYENFYSEAERYETSIGNLGKALGGVGVELPEMVGSADEMKAAYRALVEAQDLNTEAGQKAYAMLIQSSGAFAELATYAGQAVDAVAQRLASSERRYVIDARRAIEKAQQEAFEASLKAYEEGAKPFDDLRATLLSAGDAAGLLGATIERALSNPTGKYMAGGVEYDQPRWESDTTAAGFNYDWGVMQMRLSKMLSDEVSANALRIENAGQALTGLAPNIGEYSPVVGPVAQALTNAVVEASGDMGYAVRDSVYQAMLGVAQQDVYSQFASQGPGLADIRYAQQQAGFASQAGWVAGIGMQFGADVVAYGNAVDKLSGRLRSGQITTEQYESAVDALNRAMPTAVELLGDTEAQLQRMADAAHAVAMAGARSIDHYFGELRKMAQELEKTEEPINKATAAIGRMSSWVSAFGESAQAAGEYSKRTEQSALIAQAAGIAAGVLTTADARKAAEELAKDAAFAGVEGAALRDMSLLVDGIKAFDPDSWERSMIRMSDALGQGVIDEGQYAALFNYSLDVFEDTARTTQQLEQSFDRLRDAAGSLADELLLDRDLTTLSFGQQYAEAQRQYQEVMRRAMSGDVDAAGDLDRVTRNFWSAPPTVATRSSTAVILRWR